MCGPPDKKRKGARQDAPIRSHKPPRLTKNEYADAAIVSRVSVCSGRLLLGHILETDAGQYRAVAPDGLLIGSFKSRPEAARAFHEVRRWS